MIANLIAFFRPFSLLLIAIANGSSALEVAALSGTNCLFVKIKAQRLVPVNRLLDLETLTGSGE